MGYANYGSRPTYIVVAITIKIKVSLFFQCTVNVKSTVKAVYAYITNLGSYKRAGHAQIQLLGCRRDVSPHRGLFQTGEISGLKKRVQAEDSSPLKKPQQGKNVASTAEGLRRQPIEE